MPLALPGMLLVFVLVILFSGYVSAATLGAAVFALLWALVIDGHGPLSAPALFTVAMAALVTFKHRENIRRLLRGDEHRFEKARLIGRWLERKKEHG
jgi:glycerol-3-phosphate acyltransferase PlsY